jgi:hypothetical protein
MSIGRTDYTSRMPPADLFLSLETSLLTPATRCSRAALEQLLAPDFREFASTGRIYSREEIIEAVLTESPVHWTIQSFQVHELSDSLALATYTAIRTPGRTTPTSRSIRSSLWQRTDNSWQLLFHQGTPIPA